MQYPLKESQLDAFANFGTAIGGLLLGISSQYLNKIISPVNSEIASKFR